VANHDVAMTWCSVVYVHVLYSLLASRRGAGSYLIHCFAFTGYHNQAQVQLLALGSSCAVADAPGPCLAGDDGVGKVSLA